MFQDNEDISEYFKKFLNISKLLKMLQDTVDN